MSDIDRQRITAVRAMEALGYTFTGIEWKGPEGASAAAPSSLVDQADAMHALLVLRADKLEGCAAGSEEETEFGMISEILEDYEAKRWPDGKVPGGKG
jgi:hypothetical protein